MSNQTKINHNIIESLLFLVDDLKKENQDIDQQNEKYPLQSQELLKNMDKAQAAVYLKAFVDGMPGGFFIYRADETEEIIYANKVFVMDKGKIAMEGSPKEIFSQVEKLKSLRLDVPQVTLLAHELRESGLAIPAGILTCEELVASLSAIRRRRGWG